MTAMTDRLPLKTCLGFGVGTVGVSIMLNAVTAYYPAFMSTVLGQSPAVFAAGNDAGRLDCLYDCGAGDLFDRLFPIQCPLYGDAIRIDR